MSYLLGIGKYILSQVGTQRDVMGVLDRNGSSGNRGKLMEWGILKEEPAGSANGLTVVVRERKG